MEPRSLVAERSLVAAAVGALTARALAGLPFESLAPTKALLKRFFSGQPWGPADDEALASAVGPGDGRWEERLDDDLVVEFGWFDGHFRLRVGATGDVGSVPAAPAGAAVDDLAATFEGDIVPEATPNPRTLAFRTGPVSGETSREYRSAAEAGDQRVARLFEAVPDLVTVLVAREFVALTLRRADRWPALLAPVLALVAEEFGTSGERPAAAPAPGMAAMHATAAGAGGGRRSATRLDRAWRELGGLRPGDPADRERLLAAAQSPDSAARQVAAGLLGEAPPEVAATAWARLVEDPSRVVRRAAVDAVVDAGREELRPLLEGALADVDAWVRWKALRGLGELGASPSRALVEPLTADPDFRVRLEARAALRR